MPARARAAIGMVVKSGWACAVLVDGTADDLRVVDSRRVELSDPDVPEARQPYHEGFGTARTDTAALSRLIASIRRFGRQAMHDLIRAHTTPARSLHGIGLVVGSLIDPAQIANDHIRIHALEGRLFRGIIEEAAARDGLRCAIWRERDLYACAAEQLHRPEPTLRTTVAALGRTIEGPWRAEQKAATIAGWLVLAGLRR